MNLSKNITFEAMTNTSQGRVLLAANRAEAGRYLVNMKDHACFILEPIWAKYGPYTITSGFRGPSLNTKIGGSPTSLHCYGKAADLWRPDWTWEKLDEVCLWLQKDSGLKWGEFVREKRTATKTTPQRTWLHIASPAPGNNMEMWDGIDNKYTRR